MLRNLELKKISTSRHKGSWCGVDFSFKGQLIKKKLRINYDKKLVDRADQK